MDEDNDLNYTVNHIKEILISVWPVKLLLPLLIADGEKLELIKWQQIGKSEYDNKLKTS